VIQPTNYPTYTPWTSPPVTSTPFYTPTYPPPTDGPTPYYSSYGSGPYGSAPPSSCPAGSTRKNEISARKIKTIVGRLTLTFPIFFFL